MLDKEMEKMKKKKKEKEEWTKEAEKRKRMSRLQYNDCVNIECNTCFFTQIRVSVALNKWVFPQDN